MVLRWFGLRAFEVWLTARLLGSPTFHRLVGRVHRKVQHIRHGVPPEEMGGTKLENNGPGIKRFLEYFREEIKDQFKGKPPNKL
ncbi:hypothetical protein P175DRAFT_0531262 [Aspergillus ochraceoroseus IBT 24754]|uniref:Uncharacterized protein n=2 Tax=Aspergillus ochraceoroseus TaxID=138278 RepID=A0A2T5LZN3_9EURO|nr:uncharacterized protein P175DRAFT_0531262 [Aspergillus ochraceoroseus IBT 24754]KKK15334.1 hypothetical protein AOCH_006050 [Aspergillus ochraceoroseus]PTU21739.1 hypothetical protein P175DRAFT_0531262 [Aspergillus ochraceoroseus IBT 24754]